MKLIKVLFLVLVLTSLRAFGDDDKGATMRLGWDPVKNDVSRYEVLLYTNITGPRISRPVVFNAGQRTVCTLTNLNYNKLYYATVRCYDSAELPSDESAPIAFWTPKHLVIPGPGDRITTNKGVMSQRVNETNQFSREAPNDQSKPTTVTKQKE